MHMQDACMQDVYIHPGEALDVNEEHVTGHWGKGNPCCKVTKDLTELCPIVLWRIEIVNDELRYLAQEISKQNVEGATCMW